MKPFDDYEISKFKDVGTYHCSHRLQQRRTKRIQTFIWNPKASTRATPGAVAFRRPFKHAGDTLGLCFA